MRYLLSVAGCTALLSTSFLFCPSVLGQQDDLDLPDLTEIRAQLEAIRGRNFTKPVPSQLQSPEEFRAYVSSDLDTYFPPGKLEGMMDGLLRLGVMSERIDLAGAFTDAVVSQAAAYYDPKTETFYYLSMDMPADMVQTVAAHELVHALQDQYFDLDALLEPFLTTDDTTPRNDDAMLALRCLVEGEATYVHTIWQLKNLMNMDITENPAMEKMQLRMMAEMDLDQLSKMADMVPGGQDGVMAEAMEAMKDIPRYILNPLYAAYMNGAYFTMSLRHDGGWDGVDRAFIDLPVSTEQCLHPDRYIGETRDMPTMLQLPLLATLDSGGWEQVDSAIHGELYLNLLLREQGAGKEGADQATTGWDGDIYRAYRHDESGSIMFVLATTWDTDQDATEFADAYIGILENKYPDMMPPTEANDGSSFWFVCGDNNNDGVGSVVVRGQEVFVVEGADPDETNTVLVDLQAMPIDRVGRVAVTELATATAPKPEQVHLEGFSFTPQPGWTEENPESEMRVMQYILPTAQGDTEETRLIIYFFGNRIGGDVDANIDRWLDQFDRDAEATISQRESHGITIHEVDLTGTYQAETFPGSGQFLDEPGQRMLASIVQSPMGAYYVKIVGPKATVTQAKAGYDRFLDSIKAPESPES